MTTLEAGAFVGVFGGAVAGAMLCRTHGVLAETGGAICGGIVGLFAGIGLGFVQPVVKILARVYWEVLTGRRKLPSISSTPETQRRRLLGFVAMLCVVAELLLAVIYFAGTDAQQSRVLMAAVCVFGVCLIGWLILARQYRRHPVQKDGSKDE